MTRVVLLAAALAALAWTAQAPGRTLCTPGTHSSGGVTYRTFCGSAHATVKAGGKTYSFKGGECSISSGYFTINIGTITIPVPGKTTKPKYTYFGLTIFAKKDGTYKDAAITWQFPGKSESIVHNTTVLGGHGSRGTFTGKLLLGHVLGTGSFACR
jgi:hypothetical protein